MPTRNEQIGQGEPISGADLLLAITTLMTEQRKVRQLQARRDQAATKLRELLNIGRANAVWPTTPDEIPEMLRLQAGSVSLEYILAREMATSAVRQFGFPGRLDRRYLGLSVLVSARDDAGDTDVIGFPQSNRPSDLAVVASGRSHTLEVAGITAESPQISDGILRVVPDGGGSGIFAEVSVVDQEMRPQVNIWVRNPVS